MNYNEILMKFRIFGQILTKVRQLANYMAYSSQTCIGLNGLINYAIIY